MLALLSAGGTWSPWSLGAAVFSIALPDRSVLEMWMIILKRVLPLAIVFGGKALECANVFL